MREHLTDVNFLADQADWEAHQVPDRDGWHPDPMHEYDPSEDPTTYTGEN